MANLADDDLLLVQRTSAGISTNYSITGSALKEDLGGTTGLIRPPVEVLTPLNGSGITEFTQYEPLSSAITAVGEAGTLPKDTDEIISVATSSTGSVEFDGDDWLVVPSFTTAPQGTNDWTIEFYAYFDSWSGNRVVTWAADTVHPYYRIAVQVESGKYYLVDGGNYGGSWYSSKNDLASYTGVVAPLNKWHHVAVQRASGVDTIYVDGQVQFTASGHTSSSPTVTGNWVIGGGQSSTNHMIGKLSNFRVLNGIAQYSSTFTPPATPLTNTANTVLLCCQSGSSATEAAVSPGTLTANGNPTAATEDVTGDKVLSFPTNTNFSGLSVGDVVQPAGINVTGQVILYHWTQNNGTGQEIYINGQKVALGASNSMQQLDITTEAGSSITSMEIHRVVTSGGAIAIAGISVDGNLITGEEFVSGWDSNIVWEGAGGAEATFDGVVTNVGQTYTGLPVAPSLGGLAVNAWNASNMSNYAAIASIDSAATPPTVTVTGGNWDTSDQSQTWSDASSFVSSNGFNASYPATKAFDGSTSTYAQATSSGGNITFTPSTPISYSSSIKILMPSAGAQAVINGGSAVNVGNTVETTIASGSGTLTSLVLTASNIPGVIYIKVDDEFLIDPVEDSQVWSSFGTGSYYGSRDWSKAFDGVISTSPDGHTFPNASQTMTWTPPSPITVNESVVLYGINDTDNSTYGIKLNGGSNFVLPANSGVYGTPVTVPANDIGGSLSSISLICNASHYGPYLTAIKVDGKFLIDAGIRNNLGDRKISSSISYEKSLTFADTTQLANMVTPLEMVDANGDVVTPVSDTISNVNNNVLTLASDTNLAYFQPGDEVQTDVEIVSVDSAAPSITVNGGNWYGADGTGSTYEISKSLAFNSSDQDYLSRTPSAVGSTTTFTISTWVKRTVLSSGYPRIFGTYTGGSYIGWDLEFNNSDQLDVHYYSSGGYVIQRTTTAVYRDPSAWYHVVLAVDLTISGDNSVRLYVDGTEVAEFSTKTNVSAGYTTNINTAVEHRIGYNYSYSDFYLAEYHFVDGQQLEPTAFGAFDSYGVWQAKEYSGSHGTNGFYLNFSDDSSNASLGYDASGGESYSSNITGTIRNPEKAFNGVIGDDPEIATAHGGEEFTINFSTPISGALEIRGGDYGAGGTTAVATCSDGTVFPIGNAAWPNFQWFGPENVSNVTSIAFTQPNGGGISLSAIRLNGELLIDRNDWTVHNLTVGTGTGVPTPITWSNLDSYPTASYGTNPTMIFNGVVDSTNSNIWYCAGSGTVNLNNLASKLPSYVGTFEIWGYQRLAPMHVTINGTQHTVDLAWNGGYKWDSITVNGSIDSLSITGEDVSYWGIGGIRIDGVMLVDGGLSFDTAYDNVPDSPTSNHVTLNPLSKGSGVTLSNGNLDATSSSWAWAKSTIAVSSGKWYWEVIKTYDGIDALFAGIAKTTFSDLTLNFAPSAESAYDVWGYGSYSGNKMGQALGSGSAYGVGFHSAGDVIGVALDMDAGTITFYKNGVSQGEAFSGITGEVCPVWGGNGGNNGAASHNFGQRPFTYSAPSGYKALTEANLPEPTIKDGSKHFDVVTYQGGTAQTISGLGFSPDLLWYKTRNGVFHHGLQDSVRGVGKSLSSSTTAGDYTETNGLTAFTSDGFTLDGTGFYYINSNNAMVAWAWNAGDTTETIAAGSLTSSVYDQSQTWSSDLSSPGGLDTPAQNAFDGNLGTNARGIGSGANGRVVWSPSGGMSYTSSVRAYTTYVSGGGHTATFSFNDETEMVTNDIGWYTLATGSGTITSISHGFDNQYRGAIEAIEVDGKLLVDSGVSVPSTPSMNSTVKSNPEAGFSIVTGTQGAGVQTWAHGLNTKPEFIIFKRTSGNSNWFVSHSGLTNQRNRFLYLNGTQAQQSNSNWFDNIEPTSSVITTKASGMWNENEDFVAYCFAPVEGYSAMGSYTGNGSSDGPFVHTGFKIRFLLYRRTDVGSNWYIMDTERDPDNVTTQRLLAEAPDSEYTYSNTDLLDVNANGFKVRSSNNAINANGGTYIYYAVAENPTNVLPEADPNGDTQVALDPLAAIATEIVETDGTTMYLNSATGPWRTGLSIEGSQINAAPPGPNEVTFTSMNDGTTPVSMLDATLSTRTWTLESGASATGPWTLIDSYVDFDALGSQDGATPWTTTRPTLQPNTFYRIKVSYDSLNADSVESVFNTFKTGDA